MKYAEILFNGSVGRYGERFNSMFHPFDVAEMENGYKITLNISENADEKIKERVFSKTKKFLCENAVAATVGLKLDGFYFADGILIKALSILNYVKPDDEIVIIGDGDLIEILLSVLCPKVKFVSLMGSADEKFISMLFREYGIKVQKIYDFKHDNLKNADSVICCRKTKRFDYIVKADCKIIRLYGICKDRIMYKGNFVRQDVIDAQMYVLNRSYRSLTEKSTKCSEKLSIIENIGLSKLTSL